jgi:HlyD family secretion protein
LKLKPGMTANVSIEVLRRTNVLRVANAAMRFRPTAEMFRVLNQPAPPEFQPAAGGRSGQPRANGGSAPSRQAQPGSAQSQAGSATAGQAPAKAPSQPLRAAAANATTIDALFAPVTTTESRATVWQYDASKLLKPLRLRLGASDGTFTEVLNETAIPADAQVVTAMKTGLEAAARTATATPSGNPLMGGGPPGGRGPGGGRGF